MVQITNILEGGRDEAGTKLTLERVEEGEHKGYYLLVVHENAEDGDSEQFIPIVLDHHTRNWLSNVLEGVRQGAYS